MSSHHFVRDGQEPALLILTSMSWRAIEGLLEWSPYIIISDEVLEKILSWGIRVDAVITTEARRVEVMSRLNQEQVTECIGLGGDEEILQAGLNFLNRKGYREVNVFTSSPETAAKEVGGFSRINPVLLDSRYRWVPVLGGYKKWLATGSLLKFGFNGDHRELMVNDLPFRGSEYIVQSDGFIRIFSRELLWIGETY